MDYREMSRIGSDPIAVRGLAALLLQRQHASIERMHDFLTDLRTYDGKKPLSTRQLETLLSLRDTTKRRSKAGKYQARVLAQQAWERRLDLNDEESEDWLDELRQRSAEIGLTDGEWRRLAAICRLPDIGLLAPDEWIALD